MQSHHGDLPHGLDSIFTHLKWVLGDKKGEQSHKNSSSVQHRNWEVHVLQTCRVKPSYELKKTLSLHLESGGPGFQLNQVKDGFKF